MKATVLFADGFEEIEGLTIIDLLRRAEIHTDIIGISKGEITGAHGVKIIPDGYLENIDIETIDALILPGGAPGFEHLANNEKVLDVLKKIHEKAKIIAAICASPFVLAKAGVLNHKKATIYPGMEDEIQKGGGRFQDDIVVIDGNIITSRGPATSIPFALTIVELLTDKQMKEDIEKQILADLILKKIY